MIPKVRISFASEIALELTLVLEDDINVVGSQQIALITDSCVAIIRQVPNQKLYFKNDERRGDSGREEDDIIAWTWKHFFMYPNQPDWLVRLPMTKTVRLGMLLTFFKDLKILSFTRNRIQIPFNMINP